MFSLPRDTVDVPVPAGPAQQAFGSVYTKKINAWFTSVRNRPDLFPGTDRTRGYNGLKAIIGNLYGLDIKYFVEVNFEGFVKVVDVLGGVTINVQIPVVDDRYPGDGGRLERIYIPSGIQHMDGAEALRYARSRHSSNDFDRGARQQRVLLSLREQADPQELIPHLPELVSALKQAVRTDIPHRPARRAARPGVGDRHQGHPLVRVRPAALPAGVPVEPARLHHRSVRRQDPGGRPERVHHRSGRRGAAPEARRGGGRRVGPQRHRRPGPRGAPRRLPRLLRAGRLGAAPEATGRRSRPTRRIVVYNGAEEHLTPAIAYLEELLGVTATYRTDAAIRTDIVVTIGRATPDLAAPVLP